MNGIEIVKLIACIVICQLAGILGSLAARQAVPAWYATINKPSFRPPDRIFGPVWITLYLLMGIALYLVVRRGFSHPGVKIAVFIFAVQLFLNAIWSPLFFGLHSPLLGLIDIILLWVAIVLTIWSFYFVSLPAAVLLVPYILWVSFAAILNFRIWQLNP